MNPMQVQALHRLLKGTFGHTGFRPQQLEAIAATLSGKDCLLVLPTGGGKSITFQLPALYRDSVTVVVTPLLALGKDQLERCLELGIDAAMWSSETPEEKKKAIARELSADFEDTSLRLLYTTPESLCKEQLRDLLILAHQAGKLASIAIDEAHCVSEWGHDFRPAYLQLGEFRQLFPGVPVIAVTATATQTVRKSIIESLRLKEPVQLCGGFNRPNIEYVVKFKELIGDGSQQAVLEDLLEFLRERTQRGQRGIIYCRLRKTCDWLASELSSTDIDAAAYHAGKDTQMRGRVQQNFAEGACDVVVATIAFGMGIDVADVNFVVHYDPPSSIEGFYQESGRAGRDGNPSMSLLYASNEELKDAKKMEKGVRQGAIAAVASYIQEPRCRRRALLAYFQEQRGPCNTDTELKCDVCQDPQAVCMQLRRLEQKVEAAAVAERAAELAARGVKPAPEGNYDPYDRCDAGSGGKAPAAEGEGSDGGSSDTDVPSRMADPFMIAKQLSAPRPGWAGAGRPAGQLPALGRQRLRAPARPELPFRNPATAGLAAAATSPGDAAAVEGSIALQATGTMEGEACSSEAAGAGWGAGAVEAPTVQQPGVGGLKRLPLRPLLPNRPKRPAVPAAPDATKLLGSGWQADGQQEGGQQLQPPAGEGVGSGEQGNTSTTAVQQDAGSIGAGGNGAPTPSTQAEHMHAGLAEARPAAVPPRIGLKRAGRGGFKPPLLLRPPSK